MSYIRLVRLEELSKWLQENGLTEPEAEDLADRLIERYDILTAAKNPV